MPVCRILRKIFPGTLLLMGILLLMAILPIISLAGESSRMSLRESIICGGPEYRVGELLESCPDAELAGHILGRSPRPGGKITLTRNRLERILSRLGWDGALTGARRIELTTPLVELDPTALEPAVVARLEEDLGRRGLQLNGKIQGWPRSLRLSTTSLRWQLDLDGRFSGRDASARIEITDRGGFQTSFRISFRCSKNIQVPVAVAAMKPGEMLNDWTFEERDSFRLDGRPLTQVELQGSVARRHLKTGQPITVGNMKASPLVTRGREVTIGLQRGAVSVTMSGIAQGDAALGDLVMVRHLDTRKLRRYRVTGQDRVSPTYIELSGGN
jgi:flagella basal body P-ring formation protein FlgA